MKFIRSLSLFTPRSGLRGLVALYLFVLFFGIYWIVMPSRIFISKAVFRYFPENTTGTAVPKSAGDIRNLPEYFFERPSMYAEMKRVILNRKRIKIASSELTRSLRVKKKVNEPEYAVEVFHADPRVSQALRDVFLTVLIRKVREAETGYFRSKRKIVEHELLESEKELTALRKKANYGTKVDSKRIQDEIKSIQGEIEQLALKKAEAQEVLVKLRARLRREKQQVISGASVNVNPEYKEAKFKLLDLQSSLAKKREEETSSPEEIRSLETKIRILTDKINTRIPKYVEIPQSAPNPAYGYILQEITQKQMMVSSFSMQMRLLRNKMEKQKSSALSSLEKSRGTENLHLELQRVENKIYALQSIMEDVKLELMRPDSVMVISKSKKAGVLRPVNTAEVLVWISALALVLACIYRLLSGMRKGILDFTEVLQSHDVPVLVHHSGREQDNVYIARMISYICHEIPFKTLLFLASRSQVTSAVCDIGVHLSQKAGRVLLVDADFHMPALHGFFEVKNDAGFYSILSDPALVPEGSVKAPVEKIERHIIHVTPECGFIGTGTRPQVPFKGKIKKENLEAFLETVRSSDVMLLFYATMENNITLDAFLPYIEGIVLCCPEGEEMYSYSKEFLSFIRKFQHKIIGSVLFPSHARKASGVPALFNTKR